MSLFDSSIARKIIANWLSILLLASGVMFVLPVCAKTLYLQPGESQVIESQGEVSTVFISSPSVADYEIVGERSIIIYGQSKGNAQLTVFDKDGKQLTTATLVVDDVVSGLQKQIRQIAPDSDVSIKIVGQSYILDGSVRDEAERDRIYRIVGEGIGASKKVYSPQLGDDETVERPWLDKTVYDRVVNNLTLPMANQVNVKLSIVEVTKTFSDNIGIDWATLGNAAGNFSFIKKFDADTLRGVIHAIGNDSIARVLAEPNLSVLSGEAANFLVGGQIPVVNSSANGTNVTYKDYGIKLRVGAKVMSRGKIRLVLGEEVSSIDRSYSADYPALLTRSAESTVELADGQSFILGGLLNQEESEQLSKIPLIGDIPVLGAFFRNTATERRKRELVVIATVNLVKPVTEKDIVIPDYQQTSSWLRLLNFTSIGDIQQRRKARTFVEKGGFIK